MVIWSSSSNSLVNQVITQRGHPFIRLASDYHGVSIEVENSGLQAFTDRAEFKSGVGCGKGSNHDIGLVRGRNEIVSSCVVHFHTFIVHKLNFLYLGGLTGEEFQITFWVFHQFHLRHVVSLAEFPPCNNKSELGVSLE